MFQITIYVTTVAKTIFIINPDINDFFGRIIEGYRRIIIEGF